MDNTQKDDKPQASQTPAPVVPIPTGKKEAEPQASGDQYWEHYAAEIELEKKVAEMGGIEKIESGEVKIPQDVAKEMGIKPTVTIETPIAKVVDFTVRGTSLTDDQLSTGLQKPTSSGFRWLVEWFIYQLLKAHFFLKRAGGRVFRMKN